MNDPLNTPIVQTFMTHRMTDESILALATDREPQQKKVQGAVMRSLSASPGALQHCVIYGPRGFGKSFMTRLIQIETHALALKKCLPIPFVLLPEEQQNLTRNPHALPSYIAHRLSDLRTGEDSSWGQAMFQWPEPDKEAELWDSAVKRLEQELDLWLPDGSGLAVVVIENFDSLLTSVFKDSPAEQRLRKWLDRPHNRLMLIATATGSVDMDYDRPLFQAFQSVKLTPWSQEACIVYFNRRRTAEGLPRLNPEMEAKARAIADFIGGNPRLAQLLADVIETQDALSVAGTMNALADKLSDYYRRRIDDLAQLSQGLLDALIRGGEPASQTELATRVNASSQSQIARVMQELIRSDIINGTPARDSRETLYRVTDRVFVHFYRLRQGNQLAVKTPLTTILDFLRAFYSADEKRLHAMEHLKAGRIIEGRLFADLALENSPGLKSYSSYSTNFAQRTQRLISFRETELPLSIDDITARLKNCPEDLIKILPTWSINDPIGQTMRALIEAQALTNMGLSDKAAEQLEQELVSQRHTISVIFLHYELLSLSVLREDDAALLSHLKKLVSTAKGTLTDAIIILLLRVEARNFALEGQLEAAEKCANKAISFSKNVKDDEEQLASMTLLSWIYGKFKKYEESLAVSKKALILAERTAVVSEQVLILSLMTTSFCNLDRIEMMLKTASKWANVAKNSDNRTEYCSALGQMAWALDSLGRNEEAIKVGWEAISLANEIEDNSEKLYSLRTICWALYKLHNYSEVLHTSSQAIELAEKTDDMSELCEILRVRAKAMASLNDYSGAIKTCLRSIEIARSINDSWTMEGSTRDIISFAAITPCKDAVEVFLTQAQLEINTNHVKRMQSWGLWLNDFLAACVRIGDWSAIDTLLENHSSEVISENFHAANLIGEAFADIGKTQGLANGYTAARNSIQRVHRLAKESPLGVVASTWMSDMISGFAIGCRDPDFIRTVSNLLISEIGSEAEKSSALLLHLAEVLEDDDPEKILIRVDPDVAIWLRRCLNMPEPEKKRRKRRIK